MPLRLVLQTAQGLIRAEAHPTLRAGEAVRVFVRPENIGLTRKRHSDEDWTGTVRYSIYQGDCWDYTIDVNGTDVRVRVHNEKAGLGHGDAVHLSPDGAEAVVMPMRDGVVHSLPPAQAPAVSPARGHVIA